MGLHTIPQDVEVADKILGPLTLKQFIFAILFFGSAYLDYVLFQAFMPLVIIGLPFTIIFGVFAFYHRSDQPIEVYIASALKFYTKPNQRVWAKEGYERHVEITAPKKTEEVVNKNLSSSEIRSNLDNLSKIMDTRGWSSKNIDALDPMGVNAGTNNRVLNIPELLSASTAIADNDQFYQQGDILDDSSNVVARELGHMVEKTAISNRQRVLARIQQSQQATPQPSQNYPGPAQPQPTTTHRPASTTNKPLSIGISGATPTPTPHTTLSSKPLEKKVVKQDNENTPLKQDKISSDSKKEAALPEDIETIPHKDIDDMSSGEELELR